MLSLCHHRLSRSGVMKSAALVCRATPPGFAEWPSLFAFIHEAYRSTSGKYPRKIGLKLCVIRAGRTY